MIEAANLFEPSRWNKAPEYQTCTGLSNLYLKTRVRPKFSLIRVAINPERIHTLSVTSKIHISRARIATLFAAAFIALTPAHTSNAQPVRSADPLRFASWTMNDLRELLPSISRIQPVPLLAAGGAVYAAYRFDREMQDRTEYLAGREAMRIMEEFGNAKAIRPMSLLIFVGSLMQRNTRFQDAAFTSLEAVVLSEIMVNAVKAVTGRSRPHQDQGPDSFALFSGDTSFPSGHSAVAFAFVTPWVIYYPNVGTYVLAGLAAGAAFSRVATQFHWLSDVVAGSAIGFFAARWLAQRHRGGPTRSRLSPVVGFNRIGISVGL